MSQCYDWTAIRELPLIQIYSLFVHALEKEREKKAWDVWSKLYPWMAMGQIPAEDFNSYKRRIFQPIHRYTEKAPEEIEQELEQLVAAYEKMASQSL